MPGPVSDSYDPVWSTAANADQVRDGIREMDTRLTKLLDNVPPRYILDVIREPNGNKRACNLSERELRILRYACRVALEEEDI
jgi:hypothetical protein